MALRYIAIAGDSLLPGGCSVWPSWLSAIFTICWPGVVVVPAIPGVLVSAPLLEAPSSGVAVSRSAELVGAMPVGAVLVGVAVPAWLSLALCSAWANVVLPVALRRFGRGGRRRATGARRVGGEQGGGVGDRLFERGHAGEDGFDRHPPGDRQCRVRG